MRFHPAEPTLLRFAEGSAPEPDRRRMARHLAACERCQTVVWETRTVRALLQHSLPEPPENLLTRALASRAAGTLMMVPGGVPSPKRAKPRIPAGVAVAAVMAAVALSGIALAPHFANTLNGSAAQPVALAGAASLAIAAMGIPAAGPVDPTRLHPMKLRYRSSYFDEYGNRLESHFSEIGIEPASGNEAGWWVTSGDASGPAGSSDSVLLDPESLMPSDWIITDYSGYRVSRRTRYRFTGPTGSTGDLTTYYRIPGRTGRPARDTVFASPFAVQSNLAGPHYVKRAQANLIALLAAIPDPARAVSRFVRFVPSLRFGLDRRPFSWWPMISNWSPPTITTHDGRGRRNR